MRILPLLIIFSFFLSSCMNSKKTNTKSVDIQLIRNATLKLNYNGKTLLIDPSLSPKNSFMSFVVPDKNLNPTVDLPLPISEVTKGLDAILVTHTHLDHFDEGAKTSLDPNLPLFGQPFDEETLGKSPFVNVSLVEEQKIYEGTTIIRTNGKHGPDYLLKELGEVSGFVLQAKDYPTIYIVGDCLLDEDIRNTIKKYNPNIIVVNSGGAVFGDAKILMDEKKAVEVAKSAPNSRVIAVHMESLDHCKTTRQMIRKEAEKENVDIIVPNDGETITL